MQLQLTCSLPLCPNPVLVLKRGWCRAHYRRWQRYGDPIGQPMPYPETCSIPDCGKSVHARGWCDNHYDRWLKHGDPLAGGPSQPRGLTAEERFWVKVDKNGPVPECRPDLGPCWIWTAATHYGYGHFTIRVGQQTSAHRFAYRLLIGPIPEGLTLDHLCRVRACCRPSHLEPVTLAENILRGMSEPALNARKTHCKRGHEFTLKNTWRYRGLRQCKECMRLKALARRMAQRQL